jgi:hypothetical protein
VSEEKRCQEPKNCFLEAVDDAFLTSFSLRIVPISGPSNCSGRFPDSSCGRVTGLRISALVKKT